MTESSLKPFITEHSVDFDPFEDGKHFVMTIASPRGAGKTTFVNYLLKNQLYRKFNYIVICSPSQQLNSDFDNVTQDVIKGPLKPNKEYLIKLHDESKFEEVVDELRKSNVEIIERQGRDKCPDVLLILDDCLDSGVTRFRGKLDRIAHSGRHYKTSVIISQQRLSSISRSIRINSTFIVMFLPFSVTEIEQFLVQFASKKKRDFVMDLMETVFEIPYAFILLDNTKRNIKDRLYIGLDKEVRHKVNL